MNLTNNEIIKALECCAKDDCKSCPLWDCDGDCFEELIEKQNLLDLIKRLQAENERLKNKCEDCAGCSEWKCDCSNIRKEFAENSVERVEKAKLKYQRLCKEQGEEMEEHISILFDGIIGIINNLLKEMESKDDERYNKSSSKSSEEIT